MNQFIELNIKDLRPDFITILFNMALNHLKKLSPEFEELLKKAPFPSLPKLPLTITNFHAFFALESARRYFAENAQAFNWPEYVPANMEKFESPEFIFKEFNSMLKKYDEEFSDEHLGTCSFHQLKFHLFWYSFINTLTGGHFSEIDISHGIGIEIILGVPTDEKEEEKTPADGDEKSAKTPN